MIDDAFTGIAERYLAGASSLALGRLYGVSKTEILRQLKKRVVARRPPAMMGRRYTLNQSAFDQVTEESAYWIGFLMADGCVDRRGSIDITLSERDSSHLAKFRDFLGASHPIRPRRPATESSFGDGAAFMCKSTVSFTVNSAMLAEHLARFGVVPDKSLTAKTVGLEYDRHFWRGVVDGDGTVGVYPIHRRAKDGTDHERLLAKLNLVGSSALVGQFANFVNRLIAPRCVIAKQTTFCWSLQVNGSSAIDVAAHLYGNAAISLDRKRLAAESVMTLPRPRVYNRR